jgi:signal transduction histidine kinase
MEMIVSSSDLLLTVVNDVLDYSKLESGNVDIEIRQCSFRILSILSFMPSRQRQ